MTDDIVIDRDNKTATDTKTGMVAVFDGYGPYAQEFTVYFTLRYKDIEIPLQGTYDTGFSHFDRLHPDADTFEIRRMANAARRLEIFLYRKDGDTRRLDHLSEEEWLDFLRVTAELARAVIPGMEPWKKVVVSLPMSPSFSLHSNLRVEI